MGNPGFKPGETNKLLPGRTPEGFNINNKSITNKIITKKWQ